MTPRGKRAIAAGAVMAFLAAYVWAVIAIAAHLPDHPLADFLFYAIAGLAWGMPIIPILKWAERP